MDREFTFDEFDELAGRAAYYVAKRIHLVNRDPEVMADLKQAAWLGIMKATKAGRQDAGYLFGAAWREALKTFEAVYRRTAPTDGVASDDDERELPDELALELVELLAQSRARTGGRRALRAATREVYILAEVVRGRPDEGIALDLGLSPNSVKVYRQRIRSRLADLAEIRAQAA